MKRKITELEKKLIEDGWYLAVKRYTGKGSNKILCYEYHKTSDIRNNGKTYKQVIRLNQKRSLIIGYGIANLQIEYLNEDELMVVRFVFFELRKFAERLTAENKELQQLANNLKDAVENTILEETGFDLKPKKQPPMTPEEMDELCEEIENAKTDR